MKVLGHEVSQETIDKALQWFPPDRSFTFSELQGALTRFGCAFEVSDRAADRVLQQCRKAGTHNFNGNQWKRVKIAAS